MHKDFELDDEDDADGLRQFLVPTCCSKLLDLSADVEGWSRLSATADKEIDWWGKLSSADEAEEIEEGREVEVIGNNERLFEVSVVGVAAVEATIILGLDGAGASVKDSVVGVVEGVVV